MNTSIMCLSADILGEKEVYTGMARDLLTFVVNFNPGTAGYGYLCIVTK